MIAFDLEVAEGVAHVRLIRADRGHPIDDDFVNELRDIAIELTKRQDVRCILFSAGGKYFSVGADLKATKAFDRASLPAALEVSLTALNTAILRLAEGDAPVVVAVQGLCTGGALSLIGMADFVVASTSAKFYPAFVRIGYSVDAGTSFFIPRRIGHRKALEFFMLNQMWSAELALENGLISHLSADENLLDDAWSLARNLAQGPTRAFGEIRRLLSRREQSLEEQMKLEIQAIKRCAQTEDCQRAIQAVSSKQEPVFHGR